MSQCYIESLLLYVGENNNKQTSSETYDGSRDVVSEIQNPKNNINGEKNGWMKQSFKKHEKHRLIKEINSKI